ncbi:MAG: DUF4080 domain-containing protein [Gammaproteobacteria bacterium]|nr:DUF4080 domain-containing protein [Gammaproteobacteria bacterium]
MPQIILATLNARHLHPSLGLRYLAANMGELQGETTVMEFTLEPRAEDIAERLLLHHPKIIGLGVYIWNVEPVTRLVAVLKAVSPETVLVLGGPEVSHEWIEQACVKTVDYLITGQADLCFATLCRRLLGGERPVERIIHADPPSLDQIELPYRFYSQTDIDHRLIYVEASRGCPFRCEFCLSALDRTAWSFDIARFLQALEDLLDRGARHFKFVDRTFNLNIRHSLAILDFFLGREEDDVFLHFEVIPDRLPGPLKTRLRCFPPGSLQLEIGIQSLDPPVQARINRRQDMTKTRDNLAWLRQETHAHLHADLIIGLPGEGVNSFARGFDELVKLAPHEIQVGVLKRLRGTPIVRHTDDYCMRFSSYAPYEILSNRDIDFSTMQRLKRFARYWDMIANSGRFRTSLPVILEDQPYSRFMAFSDWIYETTGQVHRIALKRLFELVHAGVVQALGGNPQSIGSALGADWTSAGARGLPNFLTSPRVQPAGQGAGVRNIQRQERFR